MQHIGSGGVGGLGTYVGASGDEIDVDAEHSGLSIPGMFWSEAKNAHRWLLVCQSHKSETKFLRLESQHGLMT